jgi:hypothetical protein
MSHTNHCSQSEDTLYHITNYSMHFCMAQWTPSTSCHIPMRRLLSRPARKRSSMALISREDVVALHLPVGASPRPEMKHSSTGNNLATRTSSVSGTWQQPCRGPLTPGLSTLAWLSIILHPPRRGLRCLASSAPTLAALLRLGGAPTQTQRPAVF